MGNESSKTLSRSGLVKLIDRTNACEFLCEEHDKIMKIEIQGTSRNYINASYADGFKHSKKYIVCEAPTTKTTSSDFWRKIWQHKTKIIVMLCSTIENGKRQCYRYWSPVEEVTLRFGKFKITTVKVESTHPGFTITSLEVTNGDGECLKVTHLLYEKWQEHDISPEESSFIDLVLMTKLYSQSASDKIVVHCNSGLGRSMVFCAVDICLSRLEDTGKLNVFSTVLKLRKQRHNCLSNVNQYIFIYTVLYYYIKSYPKSYASFFAQ